MPRRTSIQRRTRRVTRGRRSGGSLMSFLRGANDWLRKNKIISKVSGALSKVGVPYMDKVNSVSSTLGYGLSPSGSGLRRAGCGRRRTIRRRR